jgi:hypothetical protein
VVLVEKGCLYLTMDKTDTNKMNKEFVTYEIALALKELGFDEPCFGYYYTLNGKDWKFAEKGEYYRLDDEINIGGKFSLLAPLYQQAFRWLREVHGIHVQPFYHPNTISTCEIKAELEIIRVFAQDGITKSITPPSIKGKEFDSYEEALEIGLQAALKLIIIK